MKKRLFINRLIAAIIDYIFVFIISFIVCTIIITNVFSDVFNQQMAPFVLIQLLLNPISLLIQLIANPRAYGNANIVYVLFLLTFCIEVVYYSFFELLPIKKTPGYILQKIQIHSDTKRMLLVRILVRNILKVLSRYMYGIPFFLSLLSKKGNTVYDFVVKIHIKNIPSKD